MEIYNADRIITEIASNFPDFKSDDYELITYLSDFTFYLANLNDGGKFRQATEKVAALVNKFYSPNAKLDDYGCVENIILEFYAEPEERYELARQLFKGQALYWLNAASQRNTKRII